MPAKSERKEKKGADTQRKQPSDSGSVEDYLKTLDHPLKSEVEALRKIILKAEPRISEGIKWNAPSFCCGDWFATFHLRSNDFVQVIFYRGAKAKAQTKARYVDDPSGILEWITNDRCMARFVSRKDVTAKSDALTRVVADWVRNFTKELQ